MRDLLRWWWLRVLVAVPVGYFGGVWGGGVTLLSSRGVQKAYTGGIYHKRDADGVTLLKISEAGKAFIALLLLKISRLIKGF